MDKKQRSMVTTIIIIAVVATIAYFVLRNVRGMIVQQVSEKVATKTVDRTSGMMGPR